jgi:predicted nucleic acid-binding protein
MKFWDSSALLPLLVNEPIGKQLRQTLAGDPQVLAWWSSRIEMASALARRERDGLLTPAEANAAFLALQRLSEAWEEVSPSDLIRATALRLLRTHPLRAADSLQLAAAVVASGREPASLEFVCLDDRLGDAARREGFPVITVAKTSGHPGKP